MVQLRQQWFESGCEWYLVAIGNVNGSVNVAFGVVQWPDLGQMLARCSSAPESARLARPWPDHGPDAGQPWLELGQTPACPSVGLS